MDYPSNDYQLAFGDFGNFIRNTTENYQFVTDMLPYELLRALAADMLPELPDRLQFTSIQIEGTQMKHLPVNLIRFTNLTSLQLQENQLVDLPKPLPKLETLFWIHNKLRKPESITQLTQLTSLKMMIRNFQSFDFSSIKKMTDLTSLEIINSHRGMESYNENFT